MSAAAGTCGPGFAAPPWLGELPVEDVLNRVRSAVQEMSGRRAGGWGTGPGPGWAGPRRGWGGWPPFGPAGESTRPRAARGDVRTAVLALLAEGPRHGYQMIQEIAERSGGAWKPSPGSIYPVLSALQDEGLVDDEKVEGRRVFSLTDAGRAVVDERAEELAHVFDSLRAQAQDEELDDIRPLIAGVAAATMQVLSTGTPEQVAAARRVLASTRRELYLLLADEEEA